MNTKDFPDIEEFFRKAQRLRFKAVCDACLSPGEHEQRSMYVYDRGFCERCGSPSPSLYQVRDEN